MSNTTQNLELPATIHPTPKPDLAYKTQYRYVGMMLDVVYVLTHLPLLLLA